MLATGLDALAISLLYWRATPSWFLMAGGLHVLAIGAAGFPVGATRSQRALMTAFTLAIPLFGTAVAVLAIGIRRRGQTVEAPPIEPRETHNPTAADIHRLTNALSACESLMSGSPDERSATVAMLARHPDAESIALLRRAVAGGDPDLAVEAALALEDLGAHLDATAAAARKELEGNPSFDRVRADADALAEAIHAGLPDPQRILPLVADARRGYETAAALRPDQLPDLARRWVRLELDALCPDAGLAVLERAEAQGGAGADSLAPLRARVTHAASRLRPDPQVKADRDGIGG